MTVGNAYDTFKLDGLKTNLITLSWSSERVIKPVSMSDVGVHMPEI